MRDVLQLMIDQASTPIRVRVDPRKVRPADEQLLLGDASKVWRALACTTQSSAFLPSARSQSGVDSLLLDVVYQERNGAQHSLLHFAR